MLFWLFLWYLVKLSSSLWLSLSPHWPFTPCSMLRTFCVDIEAVGPLRLYEQLHCFAIDNNWPEPLPARNIFCKNILLLKIFSFSAKHSLRQALFYSINPLPRMSYGSNLPLVLSNKRTTHKMNYDQGFAETDIRAGVDLFCKYKIKSSLGQK